MVDTLSVEARSALMSRIRNRDTKPELAVRKLLHGMGYRYRLHRSDLPGTPDLVFPGRSSVIFVHGCFWHLHDGCKHARMPKSRVAYWVPKLKGNRTRDRRNERALRTRGWRVMVIWECQVGNLDRIESRARRFLGAPRSEAGAPCPPRALSSRPAPGVSRAATE